MVDGVEHSAGVQVQHVESQDHVDHVLVEVGRGAAVEQVWWAWDLSSSTKGMVTSRPW